MADVMTRRSGELLLVGLMSGTSLDGIDACLVRLLPAVPPQLGVVGWQVTPYPDEFRARLARAVHGEAGAAELACLNAELGLQLAGAVRALLGRLGVDPGQVALIGSHGHTIYHDPERRQGHVPCTWQLGEPAVIAAETGITTVANFRPGDVAAGGQGAPLIAWFDHYVFGSWGRRLALQNLGGIANVTVLPGDGDPGRVLAFDTGPGNMVIDRLAELASQGRRHYDADGALAAAGRPHEELLARLLDDPYFAAPPPKSTGRERYGHRYADGIWLHAQELNLTDEDVLATATELTARSIADAYRRHVLPTHALQEVVLSGGGTHNGHLLRRLHELLAPLPVSLIDRYGFPADIKEAVAFALLAYATAAGRPNNLPVATGAAAPQVLGQISPGRNYRRTRLAVAPLPSPTALSQGERALQGQDALPPTEQPHPLSGELDRMPVRDILELMHREDERMIDAVGHVLPLVEQAVEMVAAALRQGGRLFYVGAGTSGRLGVLDAAECPPTFRTDPRQVQGIIAGGTRALVNAVEGAEDQAEDGIRAMAEHEVGPRDVVVGISASGTTPFARAALRAAKERGAGTVLLCCNPLAEDDPALDLAIPVPTGPEVLTGSTRLKAGTATKLVLNMITTAAMVRLGKVFANMMVDLHASNDKLRRRASRIVQDFAGLDEAEAGRLLEQAHGRVKIALLMWRRGIECQQASELLNQHAGMLRELWDEAPH